MRIVLLESQRNDYIYTICTMLSNGDWLILFHSTLF